MKRKYSLTESGIISVRTGFVIKCICEQQVPQLIKKTRMNDVRV